MASQRAQSSIAAIIGAAALVVGALALLWGAGEAHFRGCVAEVSAHYPPIAVYAFSGRQTGPLKVAYDDERAKALEGCSRVLW